MEDFLDGLARRLWRSRKLGSGAPAAAGLEGVLASAVPAGMRKTSAEGGATGTEFVDGAGRESPFAGPVAESGAAGRENAGSRSVGLAADTWGATTELGDG